LFLHDKANFEVKQYLQDVLCSDTMFIITDTFINKKCVYQMSKVARLSNITHSLS